MTLLENLDSVLTNSKNLIPSLNNPFDMDTDTPINVGIDKVRIGCILKPPYYRDKEDFQWIGKGGKAFWPVTDTEGVYLFTNVMNGVPRGYLTFNPARIIDPCGITCASWDETLEAIERIARIAYEQFFVFEPTTNGLDMYGMHLTADFAPIPDMQRVLNKAKEARAFRGVKPRGFWSEDGSRIESVYFNSKSRGTLKFYDKSVEANLAIPMLRIEYETVRPLHKSSGLEKVEDINESVIDCLFKSRIEPVVKAISPTRERYVDQILANKRDSKTLIQICGREFLARFGVFPTTGQTEKHNKRDFDDKYFYGQIDEIL